MTACSVPTTLSISTTMFENARCGIGPNADSSTRFGSIITKRTSAGDACISMQEMSAFMQTDLPEPVAPAMSRCGIVARSATIGSPETLCPSAIAELALAAELLKLRALDHAAQRDER